MAATILAQEGKSLFAIQHALRHEKQTTTDRYLHSLGAFSEVSDAFSALSNRRPGNVIPFKESQAVVRATKQGQNLANLPESGSESKIPVAPTTVALRRQAVATQGAPLPEEGTPLPSTGTSGKI